MAAAKARGIMVTNTPGVFTEDTADLTMALIILATRRFGAACACCMTASGAAGGLPNCSVTRSAEKSSASSAWAALARRWLGAQSPSGSA